MTELGDFSSLFIVHCVFNGFLSYTCTVLNIVTIHALRKTPSLPMTLKALLLSLSASDLGVGLIVQPLYIVRLVMIIGEETQTQTYEIIEHMFLITGNLFSYASFLGVVALAAERFLAIHFHLRYQEIVTRKRVVTLMISIWISSSFLSFLCFSWMIPKKARLIFLQYDRVGLYHCHCIILLEDLFIRTTPHNSNQQSPSTPSTAEWWSDGKYCETAEVCSWCILRVSCAFGLLFADALRYYCRSEHWAAEYPDIPSKT